MVDSGRVVGRRPLGAWVAVGALTIAGLGLFVGLQPEQAADRGRRPGPVGDLVLAVSSYTMVGLSRVDGEQVWDAGDVGSLGTVPTPVVASDRILVLSQEGVRAFGPLVD